MKAKCSPLRFGKRSFQKLVSTLVVLLLFYIYGVLIQMYLPSDLDECNSGGHRCDPNAKCFNTLTSYECKCKDGYYGDGRKCHDLDECTQLKMPCWSNSQCNNAIGSYSCQCLNGFRQNGSQCFDINECLGTSPCSQHARCTNIPGSFECKCNEEYEGDGLTCVYTTRKCIVPVDLNFPRCAEKVKWLERFWRSHPCYARNGADGTVCSFLIYLSEVEHHCPLLPGRQPRNRKSKKSKHVMQDFKPRLEDLFLVIRAENNFRWIRERISSMWKDWVEAFESLSTQQRMEGRQKKQILVFVGALADQAWAWAEHAKRGGPLGELVQWADLIAALYVLGHELYVSANVRELLSSSGAATNPCGDDAVGFTEFDIIYSDIHGLQLLQKNGFDVSTLKCKFRILDTFGTEARFNFMDEIDESELSFNGSRETAESLRKNPYGYGNWKLNLNQFLTLFPHSPDNSFLGFVVGKMMAPVLNMTSKRNIALVYGKKNYMWEGKGSYLNSLNKFVKIHGTVASHTVASHANNKQVTNQPLYVPDFVTNHGIMDWNKLQSFLEEVKIFVGLGFPFEGPAPLEAISKGCVFINPKWPLGVNRLNDVRIDNKLFFEGKPTLRKLMSQHPYLEQFIGEPFVWTVDTNDWLEVENTVRKILILFEEGKIKPYLPYEFTHEGMLQRLNAYVTDQNFCDLNKQWPPAKSLKIRLSLQGESCAETCQKQGLLCHNALFKLINNGEKFQEIGITCKQAITKKTLYAPYLFGDTCVFQGEPLVYSCMESYEKYQRLCPCRDFIKGQVALCSDCI